jgi:hypothetical protein
MSLRSTHSVLVFAGFVVFILCSGASAQVDLRARNLQTCMTGRFPNLCDRSLLSDAQREQVAKAELQANLNTCLTGRFPRLCKRGLLTSSEVAQAETAERRENLRTCLTGRFRSLCNKALLTSAEREQAAKAESVENARLCLDGRFRSLCDKSILDAQHLAQASAAEQKVGSARATARTRIANRRSGRGGCEDGNWVDSVSSDGSIVKLSDGSIWEIDAGDMVDTMLWLPITDVLVCADRLINIDDNETAYGVRIR